MDVQGQIFSCVPASSRSVNPTRVVPSSHLIVVVVVALLAVGAIKLAVLCFALEREVQGRALFWWQRNQRKIKNRGM